MLDDTAMQAHPHSDANLEYAESLSLTSEDDGDSTRGLGKPLNTFETLDEEDGFLEDGVQRRGGWRRSSWWMNIVGRARRRLSIEDLRNGLDERLLGSEGVGRTTSRKSKGWYNYCIFGGISGLTILAFLLFINLSLGIATLIYNTEIDHVLSNWGRAGSGTEGLAWYPTDFLRDINPIPCHSHNDYWRRVPLFSALRHGCISIEADVWLFDSDLYVGHNTASLTRNRTFTSLYIDPIVRILSDQNPLTEFYNGTAHGVFDTDPEQGLTLLVDVKTSGAETWLWVLKQLEPLRERDWLTFVEDGIVHQRPVTVVGTGNTPFDVLTSNTTYRDAFFDAPLDQMWESLSPSPESDSEANPQAEAESTSDDLEPSTPTANIGQGLSGVSPSTIFTPQNSYYASVSFSHAIGRLWRGRLSPKQIKILRGQIRGAHAQGLKARYWDLPAWPLGLRNHVWDVLVREGVDVLNVDDLRAAGRGVW